MEFWKKNKSIIIAAGLAFVFALGFYELSEIKRKKEEAKKG